MAMSPARGPLAMLGMKTVYGAGVRIKRCGLSGVRGNGAPRLRTHLVKSGALAETWVAMLSEHRVAVPQ